MRRGRETMLIQRWLAARTCGARACGRALHRRRGLAARRQVAAAGSRAPLQGAAAGLAAADQPRAVAGEADPGLGHHRLPRRRVPLPGLPLRRQRRAPDRRPRRPAHGRQPVLQAERHLHLPDATRRTPTTPPTWWSCASSRLRRATAFRVTLNTLKDPSLVAFTIALGGKEGEPHEFPFGANVAAPADAVPHRASRRQEAGWSTDADDGGRRRARERPSVASTCARRQIEVRVPHKAWNPRRQDRAAGRRRRPVGRGGEAVPAAAARPPTRRHAGRRRRGRRSRAAFFNVAFRTDEPFPAPDGQHRRDHQRRLVARPRAGQRARRRRHLGVLREGRASASSRARVRDNSARAEDRADGPDLLQPLRAVAGRGLQRQLLPRRRRELPGPVPGPAPAVRDLHPEEAAAAARLRADAAAALAVGELQPVPRHAQPVAVRRARHAARSSSRPRRAGPDEFYENYGAADVFDVWADVARRYKLDPELDGRDRLLDGRRSGRSSSARSSRTCSRASSRRWATRARPTCSPRCATCRC